ncbi:L-fuconolactonase [Kineosphaera limosa]|uniref:Putative hydrolase n=1 Tax=Kineosphaera limosa NBRC 100340 TaxID=1184609 RepID=K6XFG3_9MICO|nr:amidohydrolase family protein [Kineosphaera limosa]NYE01176.1 L-fuconolactonase [Kineosphaera limosa]GAB97589.1 putative hydrolase [Kineosphaera limosa NBRC 100340]
MTRIDAHLHLWDPQLGVYSWLTPDLGPIHDRFTAQQARAELDAAGIAEAVLVQAADDRRDTDAMLAVADDHPWVVGVVGWVDLEDPAAEAELDRLQQHPAFCGVRQLVHDDPRPDVYALPAVHRTAGHLARRGLTLDIPDAFPRDLPGATELARAVDGLTVVLDHLGKPPRGTSQWDRWRDQLADFAAVPGTVAKISGLACATAPLTASALRPTIEHALECFGADRLMLGSDWPITVATEGYQGTQAVLDATLDAVLDSALGAAGPLSPAELAAIRGGTARRVYRRAEGGTR